MGSDRYDITYERESGRTTIRIVPHARESASAQRAIIAPAFPLDARVRRVTVNGVPVRYQVSSIGDVQRVEVTVDPAESSTEIVFTIDDGTQVYAEPEAFRSGSENQGLRIIRARADARGLRLLVEGHGGSAYPIRVRSPRRLGTTEGVTVLQPDGRFQRLEIAFPGPAHEYGRREIVIPFVR
jgi:hypothetical protein